MLSILIPIYNFDVRILVDNIVTQCRAEQLDYEVLCYDDRSQRDIQRVNKGLSNHTSVTYRLMDVNLGRARIRNKLAREATGELLLFLDCDSGLLSDSFVRNYMDHFDKDVVNGGRVYGTNRPLSQYSLHYKYGVRRESKSSYTRSKYPARYFHTNNFLIRKTIFDKLLFDESIIGYGYEDLLFAQQLLDMGCQIHNIDNPVEHLQLDNTEQFLSKQCTAIKNLVTLNKNSIKVGTRLERVASILRMMRLDNITSSILNRYQKSIETNLNSISPNLLLLDLYKLAYYLDQR